MTVTPLPAPAVVPYRLLTDIEIENLPPPEWLIEGLIPYNALALLYGEPGIGKSFLALDWAMHVAAGRDWLGHPVRQGNVLYMTYEGSRGFGARVGAWKQHASATVGVPIHFLTDAEPLAGDNVLRRLAATLAMISPVLVVVDTFARALVGDENSAQHVGEFVTIMDALRQQGITVLLIHHSGKDADRGERGSSALRGAADTIMSLRRDQFMPLVLECRKQKDAEQFSAIGLELTGITLSHGRGDSCIVSQRVFNLNLGEKPLKENERRALEVLEAAGDGGLTSKDWQGRAGIPEGTYHTVRKHLMAQGLVAAPARPGKGARYTLTDQGREELCSR